jgi:hypothetical protein
MLMQNVQIELIRPPITCRRATGSRICHWPMHYRALAFSVHKEPPFSDDCPDKIGQNSLLLFLPLNDNNVKQFGMILKRFWQCQRRIIARRTEQQISPL